MNPSPMDDDRRARCPTCGSHELLTVTMKPNGDTISFTLCNACGWKRWGRGREPVPLSAIRPLLGKRPKEPSPPEPSARRIPERPRRRQASPRRGRSSGQSDGNRGAA